MGSLKAESGMVALPPGARKGGEPANSTLRTRLASLSEQRKEPLGPAYAGLVLFLIVYCARPEDWVPGASHLHLARVTGVLVLVAFVLSLVSRRGVLYIPRDLVYVVLLFGQLCLAMVFSIWRGGSFNVVSGFSKVVLISFVVAFTVRTLTRLRKLLFVQAASMAVLTFVCIWRFRAYGSRSGRLSGVLGGIYDNPNDIAFAMALVFPLCFFFFLRARSWLSKIFWALVMLELLYGVLLTYSRGGLLALLVASVVCVWQFGVKNRRYYLVFLASFAALGTLLVAVPAHYGERIDTIFNPDTDPTGSAQAREYLLRHSIEVTIENPVFGIGPGNFSIVSSFWEETHNTYTQLSAEAGLPALILFLMLLKRSFFNIRRAKQLMLGQPESLLLANALLASFGAFLVGCFFASVAYHYFPYFLMSYTTALYGIAVISKASPEEPSHATQAVMRYGSVHAQNQSSELA
jgi:putative inorganic carbon (hco3(-)) transporter